MQVVGAALLMSYSSMRFQTLQMAYHGPNIVASNLYTCLGISPQAGMVLAGCASTFPQLNCTHEEADDRVMFHVQNMSSCQLGSTSMMPLSGDTDVLVCLLYQFTVS